MQYPCVDFENMKDAPFTVADLPESLRMKWRALIFSVFVGSLSFLSSVYADSAISGSTVFIYKLDGTRHCMPDTEASTDEMALELSAAGMAILSSRKGYDGREGVALCGEPTGQINIYEISGSDLGAALGMGFTQLPENRAE